MYKRMNIAAAFVSGAGMSMISHAAAPPAITAEPSAVTALHCAHLIDVVNGKVLGETTILVEAGRVRDVQSGTQTPAGARAIELTSQT